VIQSVITTFTKKGDGMKNILLSCVERVKTGLTKQMEVWEYLLVHIGFSLVLNLMTRLINMLGQ